MSGLKTCLWISGILCLLSVIGLFLPGSTLESLSTYMGIESFPDSALFFYGLRIMLAMETGIGVFFIILALCPMAYGIMVPFSGVGAVVLGVICGVVGFSVKMPVLWVLGDSLSCFLIGALILIFWQQCRQGQSANK